MGGPRSRDVMLRTLLGPKALLSHLLVLAVAGALVTLGQWQFERLDQRRSINARLEERLAAVPIDLDELEPPIDTAALEYRRVTATGTYLIDEELLLRGRQWRGQAGFDVFTPLELVDGTLVLVRRGWVPREFDEPPVAQAEPPVVEVTVHGYLEQSVPEPSFGPQNPEEGELSIIQVPDLERIAPQLPDPLLPMTLTLLEQDPPQVASQELAASGLDPLPRARGHEPPDEGSHLAYAVQWYAFGLLALVAYIAYWTKRLRGRDDPPRSGTPHGDERTETATAT
ncbi:SURF1 family protein [Nitriliruptoraceae bacterium ZYF776]|nr:SURF1 family protein [Profundirhabdus halotolerans]